MSEQLTHWKKLTNPDFLGAYEILSIGHDLILTIKSVQNEMITGTNGKKEECTVAKFVENVKPMILNKTNMKIIDQKLKYSPFIENWTGKKIQVFATQVKFGGDMVDALRIRPTVPVVEEKKKIICTGCGDEIKATKGSDGTIKAAEVVAKALGGICLKCWNRAKETAASETDTE